MGEDKPPEVWWASRADYRAELTSLFDATERARFDSYRLEADRQRFTVGCVLAKSVVALLTDRPVAAVTLDRSCPDCGAMHGKPRAVGADLELSVSHSGEAVVVACAQAPCGVDVERLAGGRDIPGLIRLVLAPSERAAAGAALDERWFLRLWTRKEAITKATGDGLRVPFTQVELADDPPRVLSWPYPAAPESVSLFDLQPPPGYLAALAVLAPVTNVAIHNGSRLLNLAGDNWSPVI